MTDFEQQRRHRNERIAAAVIVLAALAAAIAIVAYDRATREELAQQKTYVPKQTHMTPEVVMLQDYLRIDTSNPPGNEVAAAQWLARQLQSAGVHPQIIESAPHRENVYARIKGKRPNEGLMLLHHMDVVPAPGAWNRPPFAAEIWLNELYGRGAIDMKGMGICELRAFLDIAQTHRQPERDIVFLAVADEEAGSTYGMRWLIEHRPDVIEGVRYAVNEGGITEMEAEEITYYGIETGTKQTVTLMLQAPRREQLLDARIALEPWFVRHEAQRVSPEVKHWMRDLAPQRMAFRDQLSDIDRAIATGRFWDLPIGYREMTQDNVFANGPERTASGWQMKTYLFNLPDTDPDRRIEWLREEVAPYGVTIGAILRKEGPVPVTSDQTPFYALLKNEVRRTYGNVPVGTEMLNKWFNDSRFLRKRGIAAYGINPFPVSVFQADTIHAVDERVRVDWFAAGVMFMRRLVSDYAFLPTLT